MINEKDWRVYASNVRSSIIVIMLFGIAKSVIGFVGGIGSGVSDLMNFMESGTVDVGIDMYDALEYIFGLVVVIGYFSYMSGLSGFAKTQANDDDSRGVRRIRGGMVWTLLAVLVDYIPKIGGFISFLFLFIAFFVLLSGYSKLKNSLTFPVKARRGASVLFGSMFVQLIGNILDLIPLVGDLFEVLFSFIAFCMVLNGWKKIKKADVNETPMTQMAQTMGVAPQALQHPQQSQTVSQDVVQQPVDSEKVEKTQAVVEEKDSTLSKNAQQQETSPIAPIVEPTKKSNKVLIGVISGIVLLVALAVGYIVWYVPYAEDRDALRTYVLATNVFLRSEQVAGVEYNVLQKVPYGSEIITYEKGDEWSTVKVGDNEGYMASAYLLTREDFDLLHGVWGDMDSKDCIESSKCRLAVLDFLKRNNYESGANGWQIFTKQKDVKPNSIFYPRLFNKNSKYTDFVFILKSNTDGTRMVVCYSFEDETEKPIFRFSTVAPKEGYIKNVTRTSTGALVSFDNKESVSVYF